MKKVFLTGAVLAVFGTAAVVAVALALTAGRSDLARAATDTVQAGYDLLETDGNNTSMDFINAPIPADFFGPGSDPFTSSVPLEGVPFDSFDPGTGAVTGLSPTDTIVERLQDAGPTGFPDTIDIEIVALELKSVSPITVTFNGGQDPEIWDLEVQVPPNDPNQVIGSMTVRHEGANGGTFDAVLPVKPDLTFTKVSNPLDVRVLDWHLEGLPPIAFQATGENWCHDANPLANPPGQIVIEKAGLTTNFFPGINCEPELTKNYFALNGTLLEQPVAVHAVQPAEKNAAEVVDAGYDLLETDGGGPTFMDFTNAPIPADFFGPGSDPLTGSVQLEGDPFDSFGGFNGLSPTDAIVQRLQNAGPTGFPDTIDIEIVALELKSVSPIAVTFNGGLNPELWDLDVEVPEGDPNQVTGTMTVRHEGANGGTFDAVLPVKPIFTFTKVSNPLDVRVLNWHFEGLPPIDFQATGENWCHDANPLASPPGQIVIEKAGLTTNFFPGIDCEPELTKNYFALNGTLLGQPVAVHAVQPAEVPTPTECPDPLNHPWPVPAGDPDCDGFTTVVENWAGTDPYAPCANGVGLQDWPTDNNDDTWSKLDDVLRYIPVFNTVPPPPLTLAEQRFDINADGKITLPDVLKFIPFFNRQC